MALARAAYSQADVQLLDDPLSAVDPRVGRALFARCIGPGGVMDGALAGFGLCLPTSLSKLHPSKCVQRAPSHEEQGCPCPCPRPSAGPPALPPALSTGSTRLLVTHK